jgi:hypothetical protein
MAKRSEFFKAQTLSFARQSWRMSVIHPDFKAKRTRKVISWMGTLQPSPISDTYTVKIDYTLPNRPKAWVIQPKLRCADSATKIPHTFFDGSVCLHERGEWTPNMFIAETIVPWLSFWLLHYEFWLATGTWHGGGHEPQEGK